jgi:hypothetical protein
VDVASKPAEAVGNPGGSIDLVGSGLVGIDLVGEDCIAGVLEDSTSVHHAWFSRE